MLTEKPWKLDGLILAVVGAFACCATISLVGAFVEHFAGLPKPPSNSLVYLVFVTMSLQGSMVMGAALVLWARRIKWSEAFGFLKSGTGKCILFGLLAALIFYPVGDLLQAASIEFISRFHLHPPPQEAVVTLQDATSVASRVYLIVFYVTVGPVGEEIFFRGILYPVIKQAGHPHVALWATSLLFAAIHLSAPIFIPLLLLGMVSVLLYEKTNNLLASISFHSSFNAIGLAIMYFGDYLNQIIGRWLHHSS